MTSAHRTLTPAADEALQLLALAAPEVLEAERRRFAAEATFALAVRRLAAAAAVELLREDA
jgi:hypothetical protein